MPAKTGLQKYFEKDIGKSLEGSRGDEMKPHPGQLVTTLPPQEDTDRILTKPDCINKVYIGFYHTSGQNQISYKTHGVKNKALTTQIFGSITPAKVKKRALTDPTSTLPARHIIK